MKTDTLLSFSRLDAIEEFYRVLGSAQWGALFGKLAAQGDSLDCFLSLAPFLKMNRRYLGTVEVPLGRIIGFVDRGEDFNRVFRPRSAHLRDRWVGVYLIVQGGDWPPLSLYRVADRYFVEDGHTRVSVARTLGWTTIRAEVWEYAFRSSDRSGPGRTAGLGFLPAAS
ncbi:MAG: hypothetical protein JW929_04215 [Anaerolineales bacterium]|nr:hypothetical protein [Anaerolineales bacterium]